MAGSILVKDVLYRVSKDLGDINPQFTRWTQRELVNALNDGQRGIAKFLPHACARTDAVRLAPGTKQSIAQIPSDHILPGDGSAAAVVRGNVLQGVVRNMGSAGTTAGRAIRAVDRDMLDACNPDWHLATGTVLAEYTFDPRTPQTFYVVPGVPATGSAVWVELSMLADPLEIPNSDAANYGQASSDTTTISIDNKYLDDLQHYMMARSHMKSTESQASAQIAAAYTTLFLNNLNAQALAMTGINPNLRSLPFSPAAPVTAQ